MLASVTKGISADSGLAMLTKSSLQLGEDTKRRRRSVSDPIRTDSLPSGLREPRRSMRDSLSLRKTAVAPLLSASHHLVEQQHPTLNTSLRGGQQRLDPDIADPARPMPFRRRPDSSPPRCSQRRCSAPGENGCSHRQQGPAVSFRRGSTSGSALLRRGASLPEVASGSLLLFPASHKAERNVEDDRRRALRKERRNDRASSGTATELRLLVSTREVPTDAAATTIGARTPPPPHNGTAAVAARGASGSLAAKGQRGDNVDELASELARMLPRLESERVSCKVPEDAHTPAQRLARVLQAGVALASTATSVIGQKSAHAEKVADATLDRVNREHAKDQLLPMSEEITELTARATQHGDHMDSLASEFAATMSQPPQQGQPQIQPWLEQQPQPKRYLDVFLF